MSDKDQALAIARKIVDDYGMPASQEQLVARIAYAYAAGNRDGYQEAAELIDSSWKRLTIELVELAGDQ